MSWEVHLVVSQLSFAVFAAGLLWLLYLPFNAFSWYNGRALVAWTIPVAVAAWALWAILSGQPKPAADSAHA